MFNTAIAAEFVTNTPYHSTYRGSRTYNTRRFHCRAKLFRASMKTTGTRRVRRLRSPVVTTPHRLVLRLPSLQRSQTPEEPSAHPENSPQRLVHHEVSATQQVAPNGNDNVSSKTSETVRVVVRCRPMNAMERARTDPSLFRFPSKKSTTLQVVSSATSNSSNTPARDLVRNFQFDLCASEELSQGQFFRVCGVIPLLESVVDGYLATVFAYGQTGSGKTYSMSGLDELLAGTESRSKCLDDSDNAAGMSDGLIPRALRYLYELLEQASDDIKTVVRASYCEIYNEQVFDLLNPGSGALNVRWNARSGFFVQDLLVVQCDSLSDVLAVVDEGHRNRRVASHGMNNDSSRSHSLLTIHVDRTKIREPEMGQSHGVTRYGKMSFVDLAGSERLKETKSCNAEETSSINRSLLTLGKVISALAAASAASSSTSANTSQFIPYRDSKLTKLLMDSLGGHSLTLMIACVSPSATALEDTLSTLNYATRAKNIRNKPAVQVDPVELELSNLRHENRMLRAENEALRVRLQDAGSMSSQATAQLTITSTPSSSLPFLSMKPPLAYRKAYVPSPRLSISQHNQQQSLQDDHKKLMQRDQTLRETDNALRQNESHQASQQSNPSPSNEMKQLRQQVQQLQQREQELMRALSRRSRGRREVQES